MTEVREQRRPVVFVGAATFDAIAAVPRYPGPDERVVADAISYAGGGPAATAAVTAARLGVPAAFVGTVGDDAEGERILQGLSAEGVDVSGVAVVDGRPSGASVIIVDRSGGTRAICTRPVPPIQIDRGATLIRSAAWVHVDHLGWEPVHRLIAELAPGDRPQLSVDAGNSIPGFTPEGVDLYVPTAEALVRTYGADNLDLLLDAARRDGARCVVATLGAEGVTGISAEGERVDVPGEPVEVVSTLGAGDVFHGALVAALVHSLSFADALRYANVVAAASCRGVDGRSAVPDHSEAVGRIRSRLADPIRSPEEIFVTSQNVVPQRDLSRLARPSGGFAMLAVDQREAMRAMFAEQQTQPVPDEQVTAFKLAATRILTPYASAVLLDKQFVLDRAIEEGAVDKRCALIAAADHFVPGADEIVGDVTIDDAVDPAYYSDRGAAALKLLVIYRPDDDPERRIALVRDFLDRCHAAGLVSIIEPVARKPLDGREWDWDAGVLAAAKELGSLGADLYKAEMPMRGQGDPEEMRRRCAMLTDTIASPWVILSSGVPHEVFPSAVEIACQQGASGFLAGRAVWASVIGSDDIEQELRTVSVPRLQRLAEIVDANVLNGAVRP